MSREIICREIICRNYLQCEIIFRKIIFRGDDPPQSGGDNRQAVPQIPAMSGSGPGLAFFRKEKYARMKDIHSMKGLDSPNQRAISVTFEGLSISEEASKNAA